MKRSSEQTSRNSSDYEDALIFGKPLPPVERPAVQPPETFTEDWTKRPLEEAKAIIESAK